MSSDPKIHPLAIGAGRITTLSFKGHLTTVNPDERASLVRYLARYRAAGIELAKLFIDMVNEGGDDRLAAYLLLMPSVVPVDITAHRVWVDLVLPKSSEIVGGNWGTIVERSSPFQMFQGYVSPDAGRGAKGGIAFRKAIEFFGLRPKLLTLERFQSVLGWVGMATIAHDFSNQVGGVMRGFLSQRENALLANREREAAVQAALTANSAFFVPFLRHYRTEASWQAACRHFSALRTQLREENVDPAISAACMWRAILDRPDIKAWQPEEPVDTEFLATADDHPKIVKRFSELMPSTVEAITIPSDRFRRLASSESQPFDLARNRHLITKVLSLHQNATGIFSSDEVAKYIENQGENPKAGHSGWLDLIRAAKGRGKERLAGVVKFIVTDVRAFCQALKPVQVPAAPEVSKLWPLLKNDEYGWTEISENLPAGLFANQMAVQLFIPTYCPLDSKEAVPAAKIVVSVRGNIPGANATKLSKPLNVLNGTSQFRPDRTIPMPGDPSRVIYLKQQALRITLSEDQETFFGCFSSTLVPQIPSGGLEPAKELLRLRKEAKAQGAVLDKSVARNLAIGERVAVFHVAPGGLRVGTLAIFKRVVSDKANPTGFEQIPFTRIVRQTSDVSYSMRKSDFLSARQRGEQVSRTRHILFRPREQLLAHFNADSFDRELERRNNPLAKGYTPQSANELNAKLKGAFQTNSGRTIYRKFAREVADICARNQVGHVVLGGNGVVVGKSGVRHAIREFYTLSQIGTHKVPTGYLPTALSKIGVNVIITSAKSATIDNADWRTGQGELVLGVPVHDETEKKSEEILHTPVRRGKKTLLVNSSKVTRGMTWLAASSCYATNAAWAILLNWQSPAYSKAASRILDAEIDTPVVELASISSPRCVSVT